MPKYPMPWHSNHTWISCTLTCSNNILYFYFIIGLFDGDGSHSTFPYYYTLLVWHPFPALCSHSSLISVSNNTSTFYLWNLKIYIYFLWIWITFLSERYKDTNKCLVFLDTQQFLFLPCSYTPHCLPSLNSLPCHCCISNELLIMSTYYFVLLGETKLVFSICFFSPAVQRHIDPWRIVHWKGLSFIY